MVVLAALGVLFAQHLAIPSNAMSQDQASALHTGMNQPPVVGQQVTPSDRVAIVNAWHTSLNNGDVDASVAAFADNAVFVGAARANATCTQSAPCTDVTGIRQQLQNNVIGTHSCFALRNLDVSGAVVTGQRQVVNDVTRRNGVAGDLENFIALIPAGKITFFANLKNAGDTETARDLAISAGTQTAGDPIPLTACPTF
jgi:ketosteroid isomerase-like protein